MADTIVEVQILKSIVVETPAAQGPPGPQGIPGPAGASTLTLTAAIAVGGHRLITTDASGEAIYADSSIASHANHVIGLSTGAASIGAPVSVQAGGEISDPSFAYTPGDTLFLGTNGLIVTAAPSTGISLVIGYAETATKIFINIGTPIIL